MLDIARRRRPVFKRVASKRQNVPKNQIGHAGFSFSCNATPFRRNISIGKFGVAPVSLKQLVLDRG
jgi:hypothetical protein